MKKSNLEKSIELVPSLLEKLGNYLKDSKNEALETVSRGSGTIASIIKVFGQPLINRINENANKNKLKDFGIETYLQAAIKQMHKSLETVLGSLEDTYSIDGLLIGFESTIRNLELRVKNNDWVIVFQPKYHPMVTEIVELAEDFLKNIKVDESKIIELKRSYFEGIEEQISDTFGAELYETHLKQIKLFILKENESALLTENIKLSRIGFKTNEYLSYEITYAEWKPVVSLSSIDNREQNDLHELDSRESKLKTAEELIEQYFRSGSQNSIERILFLIADFGKGKSVFLRNLCSKLSKIYLANPTEYLPVYFNLRTFKDFDSDHPLGIIASYLEKRFSVKIGDLYFKNKKYIFLVDSLDECGDLNSYNITRVVDSVKKIQNLDPIICRHNKIVIASRPFDDGLKNQLHRHFPYIQKNEQGRDVECFVSIYGFKKEQFNHWLLASLSSLPNLRDIASDGINKQIIDSILSGDEFDIYQEFIKRGIISSLST